MTALTKAEMADHLSELTSLNRRNFELRDKRERPGRNPKTGEEIPISARRVVTFRAGQKFRQRVGNEQID